MPPPPSLPAGWRAVWSKEQEAYYYWHVGTAHTTWEFPEAAIPETPEVQSQISDALVVEICEAATADAGCNVHGAREPCSEEAHFTARVTQTAREAITTRTAQSVRHFLCMQHWRPRADLQACVRLFHGERVEVTWMDGQEGGWAFGNYLEDPSKEGYFPQFILQPSKRTPCPRHVGEICHVTEHFLAPEEVAGYVSVEQGDVVRVLHPSQDPYVWAYVERTGALPERGWVPECVLAATNRAVGLAGLGVSLP